MLGFLPRHGAPPAFRDYAEWERFIERMAATGLANDYTSFWWDVRPHPRFGTLEVRAPDQATALERTGALVGQSCLDLYSRIVQESDSHLRFAVADVSCAQRNASSSAGG